MSEHTIGLSRRTFLTGAAALGALSVLAPTTAFAETAAEKQAEADAVRNQLIGLQADLEAAEISYYSALDERDAAQKAMEDQQAKIDDANSQISDLQDKLGTRARNMYRNGSTSFVDFVLGAASFEEFTRNWDLLNKMNENDADMVDQTKTLREELQAAKDEFARQEQIASAKAAEAKQIQSDVQAKVDQATELVSSLDAEAQELLQQEQAAAAAAAAAEAAAEAERQRQAEQAEGKGGASGDPGEEEDDMIEEAIDVIMDCRQASTSMLQRRLKLGYSRAARIIDQIEERGIIGPFEGSKPRQILISKEEWQEMKLRRHTPLD